MSKQAKKELAAIFEKVFYKGDSNGR